MKYTFLIISSLFFITLTGSKCKKDKPINPVDQLPPATQSGANTFGCLIDGKVFLPKGPSLGPILQCAYQYLNTTSSVGFFFQLSAIDNSNSSDVSGIGIYTDSLNISQNVFQLLANKPGNAYGLYSRVNLQGTNITNTTLYTTTTFPGQLTITKFDEFNQIASGTFFFTVVNDSGDTIKVTDGRFDMQFTR